ncbi:hypothetical protein GCM10010441_46680 [Kitasatospora paracochleata]|uniref:Ribosomal protein S27E n=1 Tax=Kitasatospora paracochleata TaxID=58354 RepID=A0ABT1J789_9ACTN|nr:hypothetical protein [Kitasatospora paracochleata]MCP2312916.1 ribosomal protein S27E [Kitasatospora paracochleata]
MEISIQLALDPSGFLRRECPSCGDEFKWFYGETADRPEDFLEPENYFCPYCGTPSGKDSWWTPAQLDFIHSAASGPIVDQLEQEISGFGLKFSRDATPDLSAPPNDPDDMMMVEPPCHPFEPLKIHEEWTSPIHCLMCGSTFTVNPAQG